MLNYAKEEKQYSAGEFLSFVETETRKTGNEDNRYELIDRYIYMMSSPTLTHQRLSRFIFGILALSKLGCV
jgi:Uma2 family endonuclease